MNPCNNKKKENEMSEKGAHLKRKVIKQQQEKDTFKKNQQRI